MDFIKSFTTIMTISFHIIFSKMLSYGITVLYCRVTFSSLNSKCRMSTLIRMQLAFVISVTRASRELCLTLNFFLFDRF